MNNGQWTMDNGQWRQTMPTGTGSNRTSVSVVGGRWSVVGGLVLFHTHSVQYFTQVQYAVGGKCNACLCSLCLLLCFAHLCLRRGGQNSVWLGGWVVGFSFVPSFARSFVPAFIRSFVGCVRSFVFVLLDLCVVLHCSLVCRMVRLRPVHARTHARALTCSLARSLSPCVHHEWWSWWW